ncbi:MAG: hypothetical protein H0U81_03630 [Pyrinomonadaceae bacterium]|nr:hypothetical protein [Pyrinomonadaceae bacterium]
MNFKFSLQSRIRELPFARYINTPFRAAFIILLCYVVPTGNVWGQVKVEKLAYFNQPNCYRLSNGTVEVVVTTDIGPRVIRYGFRGAENMFGELPDTSVKTELGEWKPWGGHRLWTAPEAMPRSYSPDNAPIEYKIEADNSIRLTQPVEPKTGIQKEMIVSLDAQGTGVIVRHKLVNKNLWAVDLAPWAMSIMRGGGVAILPQEPYRSHDDYLLPARPMVLWHYTKLDDPRWTIGEKYIRLKVVESMKESQKVGVANKQGWAAYHHGTTLFVKRFDYQEGAIYPDYGSNAEIYTAGSFVEVETLGPVRRLEAGASAEHVERWFLFQNVRLGTTEAALDASIKPLIAQTSVR